MVKKKEITLAQDNALTHARYNFSVVEKRAVYFIISEVRRQFVDNQTGQKDLFNDLIVRMKTSDLQKTDTQLRDMYTAMRSLRKKSIWIEEKDRVLDVGYINYFEHRTKEQFVEVQVSNKILPYLVDLAERFTSYSLTVAIALRTKQAQRFYEYCSQYKDTGFIYIKIDDLRHEMMLEDSYPRWQLLKTKVIDVAQKELQELYEAGQSDLYFKYTEDRYGRNVAGIKIIVIAKEDELKVLKTEDMMHFIKTWLNSWLSASKKPKNKAWIESVITHLNKNPDLIKKLHDRLASMQKKEASSSYGAYARHIIEEDFLSAD